VSLENFGPRARGGPILHYVTGIGSNRAMGVCTGAVQIYICVCKQCCDFQPDAELQRGDGK
jgi:hypothetical protein